MSKVMSAVSVLGCTSTAVDRSRRTEKRPCCNRPAIVVQKKKKQKQKKMKKAPPRLQHRQWLAFQQEPINLWLQMAHHWILPFLSLCNVENSLLLSFSSFPPTAPRWCSQLHQSLWWSYNHHHHHHHYHNFSGTHQQPISCHHSTNLAMMAERTNTVSPK